jgi:RecB family exonuclease
VKINEQYKLRGYIDRLVHHTDSNIFEIHDYKTGGLKSQHEVDNDRQLALYSLGIRESFENVEDVRLIWHFLDHGEKRISTRSVEQLMKLKEEIAFLIQKIEHTEQFAPNPSILCKWCEYRSHCPIIKANPNFPDVNGNGVMNGFERE